MSSISTLPIALLKKSVDFRSIAIINLISLVLSGTTGVTLAILDFGVYALVAQYYVQYITTSISVWFFIQWRPIWSYKHGFSINSIKQIWKFSSNLFYAGLLDTVFTRIDVMVIGKIFSASTLGFYTRSVGFYNLIIRYSSSSISQVFFPVISKMQDDIDGIRILIIKGFHAIGFTIFFLLFFFYLTADEFIVIFLSEKWLQSSEYFKILLLSAFSYPLSATMMNVLTGLGNSKVYFRIELVKKFMFLITYVVGFQFGIIEFLYGLIINRTIATFINMHYGAKQINLSIFEILKTIINYVIFGFIAYYTSYFSFNYLPETSVLLISFIYKGGIFTLAYIGLNFGFRQNGLMLLLETAKKLKKKI